MSGIPGRGGQNRKPTALRVIEGTWRKDRARPAEPTPPPGIPDPPPWLPPTAAPHFERIAAVAGKLGVLSTLDGEAVAMAAVALAEYLEADAAIRQARSTVLLRQTRNGTSAYPHPSVAIRADAWRRLRDALRDLGLSPVARASVDLLQQPSEPDPAEKYFSA